MGIFDGVLLASDYDGTLRGSGLEVLDRDVEAIRRFQDEGGVFVLTTGRCYSTFYRQARELPLRYPTLLSNGATFCRMETGETLFNHDLPDRCREDMQVLAEQFPALAFETYFGEDIYCFRPNAFTEYHMGLVKSGYTECGLGDMPQPWLKVLFEAERDVLDKAQEVVLSRWSAFYECIFSNDNLLELTAKNVHKGTGVLEAANYLGVSLEHVYCVGDNHNDLPMLRVARVGFAPAGSVAAGELDGLRVTRDADHGCVENVIEILEDRYR